MTHLILPKTDNFFFFIGKNNNNNNNITKKDYFTLKQTRSREKEYRKDKILKYKKKETIKKGMDSQDHRTNRTKCLQTREEADQPCTPIPQSKWST